MRLRSELHGGAGPVVAAQGVVSGRVHVVVRAVLVDQRRNLVVEIVHANVEAGVDRRYGVAELDRVVYRAAHRRVGAGGEVGVEVGEPVDVAGLPLGAPVAHVPVERGRAAPARDVAELLGVGARVVDGLGARLARRGVVLVGRGVAGV